jgi:hypothetical protein
MASIIKRRESDIWTAMFRDSSGKQHCRLTGETNKKKAQAIADGYETASRSTAAGLQQLKVITDTMANGSGSSSLRAFAEKWLADRQHEMDPASIVAYQGAISKFLSFLGPRADKAIALVTKADVLDFRAQRIQEVSYQTASLNLQKLNTMFRAAAQDNLIPINPVADLKTLKKSPRSEPPKRPFTPEELDKLFAFVEGDWRTMSFLGLYTGD